MELSMTVKCELKKNLSRDRLKTQVLLLGIQYVLGIKVYFSFYNSKCKFPGMCLANATEMNLRRHPIKYYSETKTLWKTRIRVG
ncbi:hypothetical protein SLA2020_341470 [Shorea laevis]